MRNQLRNTVARSERAVAIFVWIVADRKWLIESVMFGVNGDNGHNGVCNGLGRCLKGGNYCSVGDGGDGGDGDGDVCDDNGDE